MKFTPLLAITRFAEVQKLPAESIPKSRISQPQTCLFSRAIPRFCKCALTPGVHHLSETGLRPGRTLRKSTAEVLKPRMTQFCCTRATATGFRRCADGKVHNIMAAPMQGVEARAFDYILIVLEPHGPSPEK
jgi:hypothetical protein